MAGGMHGRGSMRGRGGHAWQILRDTVNERAVRILLECILVTILIISSLLPHLVSQETNLLIVIFTIIYEIIICCMKHIIIFDGRVG